MKTVSGTKEWAASNENIQTGCENDCKYCYAKCMALRFGRTTVDAWKEPEIRDAKLKKGFSKRNGRIMFPTTHDITMKNITECLGFLKSMLRVGNEVLIVSKPHVDCIKILCEELRSFRNQIIFRFTIGSADNDVLKYWEPGAPSFEERVEALAYASSQGYTTSVSCEPMLDDNIEAVVNAVSGYVVDYIWIGKANRLRQIISLNCPGDVEAKRRANDLILTQRDERILSLYARLEDNPKVKWKESIKKVVGLDISKVAGLDI